jgi:hypothetical protein
MWKLLVSLKAPKPLGGFLLDTDEFGLYGMFVFDEPDKEPHSHFHRSDAGFEKESYLDDILIDEPV